MCWAPRIWRHRAPIIIMDAAIVVVGQFEIARPAEPWVGAQLTLLLGLVADEPELEPIDRARQLLLEATKMEQRQSNKKLPPAGGCIFHLTS